MRYFSIYKIKGTTFESIWLFKSKNNDNLSEKYDKLKMGSKNYKNINAIEADDNFLDFLNESFKCLQDDLSKITKDEIVLVDELDEKKYLSINELIKEKEDENVKQYY